MDNISDIAIFVQVVESGSFTAAADRLDLSKSVISKYVSRLENNLGARLLNRSTRKLSLTEVGQAFYHKSRMALQDLEEAENEVSRLQGQPRGVLRLNAPMSFGILHLSPLLGAFHAQYPEVRVDLNLDDRKLDVIEAGFDLSLRISELPDSSLVARRLCRCRHAIVAAPSYLETMGKPNSPADLQSHRIVTYRYQESSINWDFRHPDQRVENIQIDGHTRINNSLAIREAVIAGMGIARMPTFAVADAIRQGALVKLFPTLQTLEVSLFLLYPQRRHLSPKVRAFVDFMAGQFTDPPAWD
ncbi:MAG: LysR substrate-binding domain-containing protein [Pseudomonadales bacterium]|nr:LysR substrate-binding domain-containing protein [Pseudomonadales bacterium]